MKHYLQTQPHPLRVLQMTEWILLSIAVLAELPWEHLPYLSDLLGESLADTEAIPFAWLFTLLCLVALGLLGLRLPTGPALSKWIYVIVQFGLILLANIFNYGLSPYWLSPFLIPYLIVAIRGCLIFRRSGQWRVIVVTFGIAIAPIIIPLLDIQNIEIEWVEPLPSTLPHLRTMIMIGGINDILLYALVLAFVLVLVNALLSERASRQQLTVAHQQLRRYALRIEDQATLQERNRIAREIHDAVGHNLTAQRIQLENAQMFCQSDPGKAQIYLQAAQQLAATALTEIRHSVSTLRSAPLQGKSLKAALQKLCHEFQQQITGEFIYELKIVSPVKPEISITIYRLAQEALTNVAKHSQAEQIKLQIQTDPDTLWFKLEDNGIGFNPTKTSSGFGLKSMRERVAAVGGHLRIVTAPGQGCQLSAKLSLIDLSA